VNDATSGQAPNTASRIPRGIALGFVLAFASLGIGYLFGRRAPPPPVADATTATVPEAPAFIGLPPAKARPMRNAPDPVAASAPGGDAFGSRPAPDGAGDIRLDMPDIASLPFTTPRAPRSDAPPPPPARELASAAPPTAPTTAPDAPVVAVTSMSDAQLRQLADFERELHLSSREHMLRAMDNAMMVRVEGTSFVMGTDDGPIDERPAHRVEVETFWIDQLEISVDQALRYNEAVAAEGSPGIAIDENAGRDMPLVEVNWAEAELYCEWVGGKLPTEAQWELAACAVDGRRWPWGNDLRPECVNADRDGSSSHELSSVSSFECGAGLGGIQHLIGNVAEWTLDPYLPYPRPGVEPETFASLQVARGGSFMTRDAELLTTHARESVRPGTRRPDLGFRCALDHEP